MAMAYTAIQYSIEDTFEYFKTCIVVGWENALFKQALILSVMSVGTNCCRN